MCRITFSGDRRVRALSFIPLAGSFYFFFFCNNQATARVINNREKVGDLEVRP